MNAPEKIPNGDGIEQAPAYTEEQLTLAANLMALANAALDLYEPEKEVAPADFIKAVENTPVHVAFGALAVATDLDFAIAFTRTDLGEIIAGKIPRADFFDAFPPPAAPAADDLLLVLAQVNVPGSEFGAPNEVCDESGQIDLGGQFITTRGRLDAAIGKTVVLTELGDYSYTLAEDQFTILSDNQQDVSTVLELTCLDDLEEGDDYTIVGINPLDSIIPEISLAPADTQEAEAA